MELFGEPPSVDYFGLGPHSRLWDEATAMTIEAVERGTPGIDERELVRRLGWSERDYEELLKLQANPTEATKARRGRLAP